MERVYFISEVSIQRFSPYFGFMEAIELPLLWQAGVARVVVAVACEATGQAGATRTAREGGSGRQRRRRIGKREAVGVVEVVGQLLQAALDGLLLLLLETRFLLAALLRVDLRALLLPPQH